jgi:hypothetical protein
MNDPLARQKKLNRLYAQILKIDEDGKDFLKNILTQATAARSSAGMPSSIKDPPDEIKPKVGLEP